MEAPVRSHLAECFWSGVKQAQVEELDGRAAQSASDSSSNGAGVRYRGSLLLPKDEVVLCFFDGPSASAVEAVARRARIPFARIVESVLCRCGGSGT